MGDKNHFVGNEELLFHLGVDIKRLGYVGLTFDSLDVTRVLSYGSESGVAIIPRDYVYAPAGDYRTWIKGPVGEDGPHTTVKYGLLNPAYSMTGAVNHLIGWPRDIEVEVVDIEVFPSPFDDLLYGCLVARLGGEELAEMNAALSILPHVDSYPSFKPHITLAYLKPEVALYAGVAEASRWLLGAKLPVTGIHYGKVR